MKARVISSSRFARCESIALLTGLVSMVLGGCTGVVGPTGAERTDPNLPGPDVRTPGCGSGQVVARRLTRGEYNNTVRDLFGFPVGTPAESFPDDVPGVDGLTVSDLFFERHETATARLADSAVTNGFITCSTSDESCFREVLAPFMANAWRRPITNEELTAVVGYLEVVRAEPTETAPFEQAVQLAIQATLMSPNFLFRFELLEDPDSPESQELGDFALASRLAYFIYESMPDADLFAAAESGTLTDPTELEAQVTRMLRDEKAEGLVDRLIEDWLATDRIELLNPSAEYFPTFNRALLADMRTETSMFANEFFAEDRSFRDMFDANFTYANASLAAHYGLPNADSLTEEFTRVSLVDVPERGGFLTQGSLLTTTSIPHNDPTAEVSETNIIVRGKFVLDHLLCASLPSPPDGLDIVQIQADAQREIPDTEPRKVREGVRLDRSDCAGCHTYIDPIGFSMENYDITGAYRTEDGLGTTVDSTGVLADNIGEPAGEFDGAVSLGVLMSNDERVSACLVRTVLAQAVGRMLGASDDCQVQQIALESDESGNGLRSLVTSIIRSEPFTHQQGETP